MIRHRLLCHQEAPPLDDCTKLQMHKEQQADDAESARADIRTCSRACIYAENTATYPEPPLL